MLMEKTLFEEYPLPWRVTYHKDCAGAPSAIEAANGKDVVTCETYTGDGDHVNLTAAQLEEVCVVVNELPHP